MTVTRTLLFARDPQPGRTKTRLIPALGAEGACRCYLAMLDVMLERMARGAPGPVELWADRPPECDALGERAARLDLTLRTQCEGDLGARMVHALEHTLACGDRPILVGSDVLGLAAGHLDAAVRALDAGADAVFAPADDGGYGLVALARSAPELFAGVPWGTSAVMMETRARYGDLDVVELDQVWDVDVPADLERLQGLGQALQRACAPSA